MNDTSSAFTFLNGGFFSYGGVALANGSEIFASYGDGTMGDFKVVLDQTGGDLSIVAVPEPSTFVSLSLGLGLLAAGHRRRRPEAKRAGAC